MRSRIAVLAAGTLLAWASNALAAPSAAADAETGHISSCSNGLHGYIGFQATRPPARSEFCVGMGFYSAVWPLVDRPLADFQIGLASSWIMPNNSDNKDKPLAPEGTLARQWRERGPTWARSTLAISPTEYFSPKTSSAIFRAKSSTRFLHDLHSSCPKEHKIGTMRACGCR